MNLDHYARVKDDNFRAEDGSYRKDMGVMFDRADTWVCRRCGSMVGNNQCANHAILHIDLDTVTGRV